MDCHLCIVPLAMAMWSASGCCWTIQTYKSTKCLPVVTGKVRPLSVWLGGMGVLRLTRQKSGTCYKEGSEKVSASPPLPPPPPPAPAPATDPVAAYRKAYSPADIAANKAKVVQSGVGQALYDAADNNDVATLQRLGNEWFANDVLNWPNPNDDGYTPLIQAALNGHVECIKVLAALPGIDINKGNNDRDTPLHCAAAFGHVECVRLLLDHPDIQVNKVPTSGDWKGQTPLSVVGGYGGTEADKTKIRDMLQGRE